MATKYSVTVVWQDGRSEPYEARYVEVGHGILRLSIKTNSQDGEIQVLGIPLNNIKYYFYKED